MSTQDRQEMAAIVQEELTKLGPVLDQAKALLVELAQAQADLEAELAKLNG